MRAFKAIDAPQRSPEWFAARLGRLTGSVAGDMLAKTKTGWSASRRNLLLRLVLERLTAKSMESTFVSAAMQAGIDREDDAFRAYEALTGNVVQRSGFLAHTELMAGCSLDGHIGDFAELLSIKCRQPAAHLEFLKTQAIPSDAIAQMRHEMWMTGARAHHYFSWNPDFPPAMQCGLVTIGRDGLTEYEDAALHFLREVDTEEQSIRTMTNPSTVLKEAIA